MDGGFSCKPEYAGAEADVGAVIQRMANKEKEIIEFMSQGFCERCRDLLLRRIEIVSRKFDGVSVQNNSSEISDTFCSVDSLNFLSSEDSHVPSTNGSHRHENSPWSSNRTPESLYSTRQKGQINKSSPESVSSRMQSFDHHNSEMVLDDGLSDASPVIGNGAVEKSPALSREQREMIRFQLVGRKKDFVHIERINGKPMNVLQGLELHTRVFSAAEQKKIVDYVYNLQRMGQKGQLRERTYSEPRKWMRGKGRVTIQFGCCYNYAVDKNGNPPGILRDEEVDPLPPLFKTMIKRMIRWHVLPPKCVPNSCIVNIYDEGDCIPPHIDHHDFLRPFCTVSFLTESNILFGSNLKILNPGEFSGPVKIPLPVGSVLILNGNGADVSKHCVPGVPAKRISITFRKMDESKLPYTFSPDPELQGLTPLVHASSTKFLVQPNLSSQQVNCNNTCSSDDLEVVRESSGSPFLLGKDDFPSLGSGSKSAKKTRSNGICH